MEDTLTQPSTSVPPQTDPPLKQVYNWARKKNSRFERTYEEFETDMKNEGSRKQFYGWLREYNPDFRRSYDEFNADMGFTPPKKKESTDVAELPSTPGELPASPELTAQESSPLPATPQPDAAETIISQNFNPDIARLAQLDPAQVIKDQQKSPEQLRFEYDIANQQEAVAKEKIAQQFLGKEPEKKGGLHQLADDPASAITKAVGNFNEAIIKGATSIPKAIAIVAKPLDEALGIGKAGKPVEEYETYQLGNWLEKKAKEWGIGATDPDAQDDFWLGAIPQGFGSVASIILMGGGSKMLSGSAAPLAQAMTQKQAITQGATELGKSLASRPAQVGAVQMAVPEYEAAKRAGLSDEEASGVFWKNYGLGATEVLPLERAFNRINKLSGGKLIDIAKAGFAGGMEELIQETVQTTVSNKVAQGSYDPKRDTFQDVLKSGGAGFFVGFVLPGIGVAMQNMTPEQRQETKAEINQALKDYKPKTDESKEQAAPGKPLDEQPGVPIPVVESDDETTSSRGDDVLDSSDANNGGLQPANNETGSEQQVADKKAQPTSEEPAGAPVPAEPAATTETDFNKSRREGKKLWLREHGQVGDEIENQNGEKFTIIKKEGKESYEIQDEQGTYQITGREDFYIDKVDQKSGKIVPRQKTQGGIPETDPSVKGIRETLEKAGKITTDEKGNLQVKQNSGDPSQLYNDLEQIADSKADALNEYLSIKDDAGEFKKKFGDWENSIMKEYGRAGNEYTVLKPATSGDDFVTITDDKGKLVLRFNEAKLSRSDDFDKVKRSYYAQEDSHGSESKVKEYSKKFQTTINKLRDLKLHIIHQELIRKQKGQVTIDDQIRSLDEVERINSINLAKDYYGEPMIMMHGGDAGIKKFLKPGDKGYVANDIMTGSAGLYFTRSPNGVKFYSQFSENAPGKGKDIYYTFLRTKKPYYMSDPRARKDYPIESSESLSKRDYEALKKLGYDSVIWDKEGVDKKEVVVFEPDQVEIIGSYRNGLFSKKQEESSPKAPEAPIKEPKKEEEITPKPDANDTNVVSSDEDPHGQYITDVAPRIGKEDLNKNSLRKIAAQYGIDNDSQIKELTEVAIVNRAREISKEEGAYEKLVDLYQKQPTLSHRTSESIAKQQYSTPVPIGYLAGKYANIDKGVKTFEPSAGNGMLTIAADPKNVTVNEIDEFRGQNLSRQPFSKVINQDGSKPFGMDKQFDAVITNPPFGGTDVAVIDGYKFNELAQIMAVRGLETMKDDGKAAIIIGGNNSFDDKGRLTGRDRIFFNYLYNRYNVDDVIDISGDLYRKQGASFPIRLILVNGRKATPSGVAPSQDKFNPVVKSFEELKPRVEKYTTEPKTPDENLQSAELVGGAETAPDRTDSGRSTGKNPDVNTQGTTQEQVSGPGGEVDTGGAKTSLPGRGSIGTAKPTRRGRTGDSELDIEQPGISQPDVESGQQSGDVAATQPEGTEPAIRRNRPGADRKVVEGALSEQSGSVDYAPTSKGKAMKLKIPSSMSQEMYDAMSRLKEEVGDVDEYVRKKLGYKSVKEMLGTPTSPGAFSAEQVDGIALAIWNIENGDAVIIGDQTGIGKGRQAAAIIRYGNVSGRSPIFLTEKPNLFAAIYRDLKAIGHGHIKPFIINNIGDKFNGIREKDEEGKVIHKAFPSGHPEHKKILNSLKIPSDAQVVMATYSQFGNPKFVEKINFLKSIAHDNIVILDESHNASGVESNTGLVFQEALPTTKGVVFLSGTYAKRPDNMPVYAMKTAMKEANMETEELVNAIVSGGTALQEIISGQLAEAGQLIRRQRSYENISVKNNVLTEKADEHRKASDTVTDLVRDIIRFQSKYVSKKVDELDSDAVQRGEVVTVRGGTNMAGVDNAPYFSKVFNVIDQMLYSIKAKDTAEEAIKLLKEGKKPFIAIRGTLESNLSDLLESGDVKYGDTIDADFAYIMQKGLDGVLRITIKDADGNKTYTKIDPKDLGSNGYAEYLRIEKKIKASTSGLSISPIDELVQTIQRAGYTIGEVTGRQSKLALSTGKKRVGILDRKKREPVDVAYKKFNSGEYDVLIVNSSGSTGEDAHADAKFKDKRQRVELVLQPELNINTLMQIIGRVNRTGQVVDPEYQFINSAIPAEQRLMAMTMRKLKSLDANTTSNQKQSKGVLDVPEFFNKYGDQVVIEYLQENPEVIEMIGDPLGMLNNEDLTASKPKDAALRVSGRIAILPVKDQEKFYNEIIERYAKQIEYLNDAGINDLEVTSLPLKAKTLNETVTIVGKGGKTAFGDDTIMEEVEVDVLRKPLTRAEIDEQINEFSGKNPEEHMKMLYEQIQAYEDKLTETMTAEFAADLEEEIQRIQELAKENEKPGAILLKQAFSDLGALSGMDVSSESEQISAAKEYSNTRLEMKLKKEKARLEYIKSLFRFFRPGRAVRVPTLLKESNDASAMYFSDGLFIGFDIDLNKAKPFLPSNIRLRFAVNDGRVSIPIPASKTNEINYIRTAASEIDPGRAKAIQEWDTLKKPKGREKRMMITGNILQGLSKFDGKIIKYTTDQGFINTGILLPDGFDVKKAEEAQEVSVPASKMTKLIAKASRYAEFQSADQKVRIISEGANRYAIRVPLSKAKGGKYFLDSDLLDLVDGNNFDSVGSEMQAKFPGERLSMVLDVLQNKFGASFVLSKQAFDKALKAQEIEMSKRSGETFEPVAQLSLFPWLTPSKVKKKPVNQVAEDALRKEIEFKNQEAEQRYRDAAGPSPSSDQDGRWDRIKDSFSHMITGFTSHFRHLNPKEFAREANLLRVFETVKNSTADRARQYLQGLIEPLTKEQFDIFTRRIVLEDLLGGIEKKLEDPDKLPFGLKSQKELEREIEKYKDLMTKEPAAQEAYDRRQAYQDTLYQGLVANGILFGDEDRKTYYHRRVLEYLQEEENQKVMFGKRLSKAYKDWRRARTGTKGKDYSTNFIESEYRVVAEGLYELEKQRILNELMGPYEAALKTIKNRFQKVFAQRIEELENEYGKGSEEVQSYKKNKRGMLKSYIEENKPEGYVWYQPTPGNAIFVRKLVSQEQMEKTIAQAGLTDQSGIGTAMQLIENIVDMADPYVLVGQKRKEYLVPEQLANQLEEMGTNKPLDPNLLQEITSAWKVYVLLNPNRFVKYNLNNMFGDIDGTLAADPSIFKKVSQAWKELKAYKQTGKSTDDLMEAIRQNVVDSGWELTELSDINNAKWANFFSDQGSPDLEGVFGKKIYKESGEIIRSTPGKIWEWYWDKVKGWTRIRENTLRYAAYLRAKEKLSAGEKFYWASEPTQIDGIANAEYKAGKLAREVLGDYGNISITGQRIRRYMVPFYAWMEINMGRYYRLFKNASNPKVQARIGAMAAARGMTAIAFRMAWAYALMGMMTALVEAWNWLRFPEETEKLRRANARGMQLILNVTDDGKVVTLPIVGAFYDFLDFFGLPDMKDDLAMIFSGESPKKGAIGAAKSLALAPYTKAVQGINPFGKMGYELITGSQLFPDPTNPKPIYDYGEYFAQFVSMQDEYRALTGSPTRNPYFFGHMRNMVVKDIDPDELSYFQAKRIVDNQQGGKFEAKHDAKSEALYRYGLAIRYGKTDEALHWMNEYYANGGTISGLNLSLSNKNPISRLKFQEEQDVKNLIENPNYQPKTEFGKSLTPKEIKTFRDAIEYYDRTYNPRKVPKPK